MKTCEQIFDQYKGDSEIGGSIYIDPMGYEYTKSIVTCYKCIFNFSWDSCVLHKENGMTDEEIKKKSIDIEKNHECDRFLIKDFSEGGNEDEIARKEVEQISKKMNYPAERWRRDNIHKVMDEKEIGHMIRDNQSCYSCDFYKSECGDIDFCNFHKAEIFASERYCEYWQGESNSNKILITAHLYNNGTSYYPLNEKLSLKANPNHTFSIVKIDDLSELYTLEPYLLSTVEFNSKDGFIHAGYCSEIHIIDIESKSIIKKTSENEEEEMQNEENWLNMASDEEWDEAINQVDIKQKEHGVFTVDRMNNCERCENVKRDDSYPNGSPTGLVCSLKNIFVTASAACNSFSR